MGKMADGEMGRAFVLDCKREARYIYIWQASGDAHTQTKNSFYSSERCLIQPESGENIASSFFLLP